jgi:hypothetical protein
MRTLFVKYYRQEKVVQSFKIKLKNLGACPSAPVLLTVSAFGLGPPRSYAAMAVGPGGTALQRGLQSPLAQETAFFHPQAV